MPSNMPNKTTVRCILIFWTCANKEEARKISETLVKKQLVACANLIPGIESIYIWKGNIEREEEVKVILKTQAHHFSAINDFIQTQLLIKLR